MQNDQAVKNGAVLKSMLENSCLIRGGSQKLLARFINFRILTLVGQIYGSVKFT